MASFLRYLSSLGELWARLQLRFGRSSKLRRANQRLASASLSPNLQQCYDLLEQTGRFFSVSIATLEPEIRDAMCLWYLVLRAVDTVEDDMSIPTDLRLTMLTSFDKYLRDIHWSYNQSKDEYAVILDKFPCIPKGLLEQPSKYRDVILNVGPRIGVSMADFDGREILTLEDVNQYCLGPAKLFCAGIVELFVAGGLESQAVLEDTHGIEQFGFLMQKVNLIKDFWKDWNSGRLYWPKSVWAKYVACPGDLIDTGNKQTTNSSCDLTNTNNKQTTNSPGDLTHTDNKQPTNSSEDLTHIDNTQKAVEGLNYLVTDALTHVSDVLHFLDNFKHADSKSFTQLHVDVALASLERCYNNPDVFTGPVKIRRGETAQIFQALLTNQSVRHYISQILTRASSLGEQAKTTREVCRNILNDLKLQSTL